MHEGMRRGLSTKRVLLGTFAVLLLLIGGFVAFFSATDEGNPTVIGTPTPTATDVIDGPAPDEGGSTVAAGSSADAFPVITSRNLAGDEVTLPASFGDETTVVLLSWGRSDQPSVDGWVAALRDVEADVSGLDHVQLAVSSDGGAVTRNAVYFFMGQAFPDPEDQSRIIPLFTDPRTLGNLLGVASIDDLTVVLVTDGKIVWRHRGEHSADAEEAMLAELLTGSPRATPS